MSVLRLAVLGAMWLFGFAVSHVANAAQRANEAAKRADTDAAFDADVVQTLTILNEPPALPELTGRDPATAVICVYPDCTLCAPLRTPGDLATEVADELARRRAGKEQP